MNKFPVLSLVVLGLCCASLADAAPKRKAGQNREGPYAFGVAGMTLYGGSHAGEEQLLRDILTDNGVDYQNLTSSTDDSDLGYGIGVGYRFSRFFAAEITFAQYGEMSTEASAELDFGEGEGFQPADLELTVKNSGPVFSAVGILPLNEHFELFARAGLMFSSFSRGIVWHINGQNLSGTARSDDQVPVYGVGASWNISKVYSLRAEYQLMSDVGDDGFGAQDVNFAGVQFSMRF
ncbi:MAG TPA: outer membrane beta-barrel protein [Steroidobacteraceae bacterium]|nr:outer membrane beta-barrel protein [Steroidobacteraceae bacterium]